MLLSLGALAFFIMVIVLFYNYLKRTKKTSRVIERVIGTFYFLTFMIFIFGFLTHINPYYKAIDIVDGDCYIPLAHEHIISLLFYLVIAIISMFLIWSSDGALPPLTHVLSTIFTFIGILLNIFIFLQVSQHNTETLSIYSQDDGAIIFTIFPLFTVLIGIYLLFKTIKAEIDKSTLREFNNKYLSFLNNYLSTKYSIKTWAIILLFPVLLFCTVLLLLFGQDIDSLVKVFTETTTWRFSQKMHPPILDHQGHYICTVAACGSPKIVKPIQLGTRNNQTIIVNRQLQIANAFEEMIQDFSPKMHSIIRKNYDKYGYNVSTKINTSFASNLTYILMKPLEWLFLVALYLFCLNPEKKIQKQYKV